MPLTLFEAQTVSWKIFRKINDKLDATRGRGWETYLEHVNNYMFRFLKV